jgi:regulator of sigma E protease
MLITILSLLIILSILVFVHELGHFVVAKRSGIKVEEFGWGYPPRVVKFWEHNGTIYSINAIPFGGFVRMPGEDDPSVPGGFASAPKLTRLSVLFAGPFMNFVLAAVLFAFSFMIGMPRPSAETVTIVGVGPNSPAAEVGLQAGDVVLEMDGEPVTLLTDFIDRTQASQGQEVMLSIDRDGELLSFTLVPRANPPPGEGAMGVAINGSPTAWDVKHLPPGQAILRGVEQTTQIVLLTVSAPVLLLRGSISPEAARPVGPVGIARMTGDAATQAVNNGWWFPIIQLTAFISAALGITNLLPIPALDGGRILFILIEAVRGKRIDPQKEGMIHLVGMALILALMFLVTIQDIVAPLPPIEWPSPF